MSSQAGPPLVAVDIGNSRIKAGWFDGDSACDASQATGLPIVRAASAIREPVASIAFGSHRMDAGEIRHAIEQWLAQQPVLAEIDWVVSSVHRDRGEQFARLITELGCPPPRRLTYRDVALPIRVKHPDRVGMDRLLGAVAANCLRPAGTPAVVVDFGSAVTVDLIASDGGFEGGAILPGVSMGARALQADTDALPRSPLVDLIEAPPVVGRSTIEAIEAGLYWGAVGSVRHIVAKMDEAHGTIQSVYLTGGAAQAVAANIESAGVRVAHVPHLILAGIAATARSA